MTRVNVLVDRHHAGLYRSLQLLADRLGWDLYTPVGLDWERERYWTFGMNIPGRTEELAQQYLATHEGIWTPVYLRDEGLWATMDPEFPPAPGQDPAVYPREAIFGVTLDKARSMTWAYVIATLDDNQWGFSRLANELGARFVVQVGNTGQYVAWNLHPLALVSSEVPIVGRGVRYHQEMDPEATGFVEPSNDPYGLYDLPTIASFVNCFPSIGPCYDLWGQMQATLGEGWGFAEYGIDGEKGVVKPIGLLHELMGMSLFGWHDKVHGDGFGHVIHGWAAVGRPLIGHGHHYRGKMAEHFWQHGRTAIDLDVVSIPEAARMVRDIAADRDRHAEMCHAIRAELDRIDHDAETDAIRRLLA